MPFEVRLYFPEDSSPEPTANPPARPTEAADSASSTGSLPAGGANSPDPADDFLADELAGLGSLLSNQAESLAATYPAVRPSPRFDLPAAAPVRAGRGYLQYGVAAAALLAAAAGLWRGGPEPVGRTPDLPAPAVVSAKVAEGIAAAVTRPADVPPLEPVAFPAGVEAFLECDGSVREAIVDLEQEGRLERASFSL